MNPKQIEATVNETIKECKQFFVAQGWATNQWNPVVRLSFSEHRNRSWGGRRNGRPFVSLALKRFVGKQDADFIEYPSFARDADIGTVHGNTIKAVKALVVHEMCHAIQHTTPNAIFANAGITTRDTRGHGNLWKSVYRLSRKALVNQLQSSAPKQVVQPIQLNVTKTEPTHTMKRQDALAWIRRLKAIGASNRDIIHMLVTSHGFKKTTATTYTYSV